jgi:hypothetical protein
VSGRVFTGTGEDFKPGPHANLIKRLLESSIDGKVVPPFALVRLMREKIGTFDQAGGVLLCL